MIHSFSSDVLGPLCVPVTILVMGTQPQINRSPKCSSPWTDPGQTASRPHLLEPRPRSLGTVPKRGDSSAGAEHISHLPSPWALHDCIPVAPTTPRPITSSSPQPPPPQGMTRDAGCTSERQLANHSDVTGASCAVLVSLRASRQPQSPPGNTSGALWA